MVSALVLRIRLAGMNRHNRKRVAELQSLGLLHSLPIDGEIADTDPRFVFMT
jgi:hypothetical protein